MGVHSDRRADRGLHPDDHDLGSRRGQRAADIARAAAGNGVSYGLFQATSALLLLAAASSSFQAGPGLLKALSRHPHSAGVGILPRSLGETNQHHTPYWSVVLYLGVSAAVLIAASGQEQKLVLVYAVAVFVSFLAGLIAMARLALRDSRHRRDRTPPR